MEHKNCNYIAGLASDNYAVMIDEDCNSHFRHKFTADRFAAYIQSTGRNAAVVRLDNERDI